MTIFVDASALISIVAFESDAAEIADALEADRARISSALALWETVAGLCRSHAFDVPSARTHVRRFLALSEISLVAIGERELDAATDAYMRYGKGRHPAALNMGDCFAYACARTNNARLLFKGDDFSKTDISAAS